MIINVAAIGLTGYLNRLLITPNPRLGAGTFATFRLPQEVVDIPVIGWIIEMFLEQGPIAMSVIVFVIVLQVLLFRSRWGLRTRAVGEHPRAADTVGINVIRLRYRNVILAGIFAGLAGAYLTLEGTGSFQNGMTAGRRLHRPGGGDLRAMDADRRMGRRACCSPTPARSARPSTSGRRAPQYPRSRRDHGRHPDPGVRRAALHRHDRHPGRRRRAQHRRRRRWARPYDKEAHA